MTIRKTRSHIRKVTVGNTVVGGGEPLLIIAGPCIVEDPSLCVEIAKEVKAVCNEIGTGYLFKASYDKANKTIRGSFRGPGVNRGLDILKHVKSATNVCVTTDVHEIDQCVEAAEVADLLQIPALLSKQIDLIKAAAATGKAVNIKKCQFTAPWEINNVLTRLSEEGFEDTIATERGYSFGYNTLISDMRALQIMSTYNRPVIYDVSHSVHGNDTILFGTEFSHRDFIRPLARSAAANGIDGLFMEVHPDPDKALSDGVGTVALKDVKEIIREVVAVDQAING